MGKRAFNQKCVARIMARYKKASLQARKERVSRNRDLRRQRFVVLVQYEIHK